MSHVQMERARPNSEQMLEYLADIRGALEDINKTLRSFIGTQGRHVDDRIPEVIERLAKTQVGCRTAPSDAEL